jgi:hypothetical protein
MPAILALIKARAPLRRSAFLALAVVFGCTGAAPTPTSEPAVAGRPRVEPPSVETERKGAPSSVEPIGCPRAGSLDWMLAANEVSIHHLRGGLFHTQLFTVRLTRGDGGGPYQGIATFVVREPTDKVMRSAARLVSVEPDVLRQVFALLLEGTQTPPDPKPARVVSVNDDFKEATIDVIHVVKPMFGGVPITEHAHFFDATGADSPNHWGMRGCERAIPSRISTGIDEALGALLDELGRSKVMRELGATEVWR